MDAIIATDIYTAVRVIPQRLLAADSPVAQHHLAVALTGPAGVGKSTMLRSVAGQVLAALGPKAAARSPADATMSRRNAAGDAVPETDWTVELLWIETLQDVIHCVDLLTAAPADDDAAAPSGPVSKKVVLCDNIEVISEMAEALSETYVMDRFGALLVTSAAASVFTLRTEPPSLNESEVDGDLPMDVFGAEPNQLLKAMRRLHARSGQDPYFLHTVRLPRWMRAALPSLVWRCLPNEPAWPTAFQLKEATRASGDPRSTPTMPTCLRRYPPMGTEFTLQTQGELAVRNGVDKVLHHVTKIVLNHARRFWLDALRTVDDVGADAVRTTLQSIGPLALASTPPTGVLIWGPPGGGKSLLASLLANGAGLYPPMQGTETTATTAFHPSVQDVAVLGSTTFWFVETSRLFGKYLGESEANLRRIFSIARSHLPSVVIFNDIDAIATKRGGPSNAGQGRSHVDQRVLAALLIEMDGMVDNGGLLVIGLSNRPWEMDGAMLRTGRLESAVYVGTFLESSGPTTAVTNNPFLPAPGPTEAPCERLLAACRSYWDAIVLSRPCGAEDRSAAITSIAQRCVGCTAGGLSFVFRQIMWALEENEEDSLMDTVTHVLTSPSTAQALKSFHRAWDATNAARFEGSKKA